MDILLSQIPIISLYLYLLITFYITIMHDSYSMEADVGAKHSNNINPSSLSHLIICRVNI